jgi:hypothetical protein
MRALGRSQGNFLKALIVLALLEITAGYLHHLLTTRRTGLLAWTHDFLSRGRARVQNITQPSAAKIESPFLQHKLLGYHLHPFVDYTGVQSEYLKDGDLDYFGFRNPKDTYFKRPQGKLIVFTGGSEAAGFSHKKTIAELLEAKLSSALSEPVTVLNLAVNSYTVPNEINAYVHFAFHLKPDAVITHTGWNDCLYGRMVPEHYKDLGLFYVKLYEHWVDRMATLRSGQYVNDWVLDERGSEKIGPALLRNLQKYNQIVSASGARFLAGIQPFNPNYKTQGPKDPVYDQVRDTLRAVSAEGKDLGYLDIGEKLPNLRFRDAIHTLSDEAQQLAALYEKELTPLLLPALPSHQKALRKSSRFP